jgi:chaperonin GroES
MKLRPLQDWAVIQKEEPDERTAGGIIIPDSAKDKPTRGVVLAIGPGKFKTDEKKKEKEFIPTTLKPGQRIIYGKYSSREFEVDGEMFTLVREEDILGIFGGAPEGSFAVAAKTEQPPVPSKEKASGKKASSEKKASEVSKAKKTESAQKGAVKSGKKKDAEPKKKI